MATLPKKFRVIVEIYDEAGKENSQNEVASFDLKFPKQVRELGWVQEEQINLLGIIFDNFCCQTYLH